MQRELFERQALSVTPADDTSQPRFWFRRLVIYAEPWSVVRKIDLRPGLNIIWSPDPAEPDSRGERKGATAPGHGAGKTLVCRLLRYCVGEANFAPEVQRTKIARSFREGRVGAELVIDGMPWAVVRSIGVMPFDMVREGKTLDEAIAGTIESTGISSFVGMLASQILTAPIAALISNNAEQAWLATLEWLARDQECRFGKVAEWRSASSESGSPKLSVGRATNVVRALVGAITPAEQRLEQQAGEIEKQRELAGRNIGRLDWGIARSIPRISKFVDLLVGELPGGELVVPRLRKAVADKIARVGTVNTQGQFSSVESLEATHEDARAEATRIEREIADLNVKQKTAELMIKMIAKEAPGLSARIDDAETPLCPFCDVPVDRALAEGCKLSHKLPDLVTLRRRREEAEKDLREQRKVVEEAKAAIEELKPRLAAAREVREEGWKSVLIARRLQKERSDAWYGARRAGDDINDLQDLFASKTDAEIEIAALDARLAQTRESAATERNQHADVFLRLERHFDPLVRRLLGSDAIGHLSHDGNGLHLTVELGGDRSTPAIDSVKILAFDLAAMCRAMEGATHLPALLIHDSPREADLGLSIYHELFRLVVQLESIGPAPLFQYIVTTTTRPPDELSVEPWLRLTVHGSPAQERLLGKDL